MDLTLSFSSTDDASLLSPSRRCDVAIRIEQILVVFRDLYYNVYDHRNVQYIK